MGVTGGDLEMITPDEPWMRRNPAASLAGAGSAAWPPQSPGYRARRGLRVVAHSEMDLSGVALLMRYIVMSAQAEGAKQNDC